LKKQYFLLFFLVIVGSSRALYVNSYANFEIDAQGYVTEVIDGDSLYVANFGEIRLADIDCPEWWEDGGNEVTNYLTSLVYDKLVYIDKDDEKDPYDRFVCVIYVRSNSTHLLNVNKALLNNEFVEEDNWLNNEFEPSTWTLYVYSPIYIPKVYTTISCSSSLSEITLGSSVTISGAINPSLSMRTMTLTYTKPDGSTFYRTTTTNSYGRYSDTYPVSSLGSWIVMASWEGDSTYDGAASSLTSFIGIKIMTSLSCIVSSSKINEGDSVTVSGAIFPSVSDVIVTLTYTKLDNSIFTRTCITNLGAYSETFTPDMLGSWRVSANWIGDATHDGASSSSKVFTVSKLSSSLSCSVSSSSLMIGDSVTVSGSLIPALSSKIVTLTYMKPNGLTFTRTCTTNPGDYIDTYTPDSTGAWSVRASWDGDTIYEGALSTEIEFTVSKISSVLTCSVSSSVIIFEDSITVSGSLSPKQEGITITLIYKKPHNDAFSRTVTTDSEGFYFDTYEPYVEGIWSVNADWEGDETYTDCSSPLLSFILDGTPPTISFTSPSIGSEIKSPDVTIMWNGTDEFSGIANYEVKVDDEDWSCPTGTETSCSLTGLQDGTHIVSIKVIDNAGNSKIEQITFSINTSLIGGPGWTDDIALISGIGILGIAIYLRRAQSFKNRNTKHMETLRSGEIRLLKINEIESGMNGVSMEGKIIEKSDPRNVNTRYGQRSVAEVILEDETGTIHLSLWEQQIDLVNVGDRVRITGAYVTEYRDVLQLNIPRSGTIEVVNTDPYK
jgi:hypothetical protein